MYPERHVVLSCGTSSNTARASRGCFGVPRVGVGLRGAVVSAQATMVQRSRTEPTGNLRIVHSVLGVRDDARLSGASLTPDGRFLHLMGR